VGANFQQDNPLSSEVKWTDGKPVNPLRRRFSIQSNGRKTKNIGVTGYNLILLQNQNGRYSPPNLFQPIFSAI